MANIFDNMMNNFGAWIGGKIAPYINDQLGFRGNVLYNYYSGDHRPQLKVKVGLPDENITQNFVGLAVDRSVSRLFKGGVQFNLPDAAKEQQEYINKIWDLNKKEIILYQVGLHGAVYGTPYFKISPDALIDPFDNKPYPRLIALDPETVRFTTHPQDMSEVEEYKIEYMCPEMRGNRMVEVKHKEIVKHPMSEGEDMGDGTYKLPEKMETWVVEEWEQVGGAPWQLISKVDWPYNFPPIIHWKNLPSLKSCYGDSDIDDAINVQDKSNFVVSNTSKIIKFHAHPQTIGTGFSVKDMKPLPDEPGAFHAIPSENAKVYNLEMDSDLASSRAFAGDLKKSIFDIAREVDMDSIGDKLGQLTNFGLHVLYTDALDKNDTKRQLYGDALKELNRRLLVLASYEGPKSDPGKITWGDAIISNVVEDMTADEKAQNNGWIDKETLIKRYQSRYGVDWEDVVAALKKQQEEDNKQNADIGATILKNFSQGKGAQMPQKGMNGGLIPAGKKPAQAVR